MTSNDLPDDDNIDQLSLMFECARSLIAGAKIIMSSDGIDEDGEVKHPSIPVIVCLSFAIEVQLKALLHQSGSALPRGDLHDLDKLFSALPVDLQSDLLQYQSAFTSHDPMLARDLLREHKDTFKRWRYPYESQELTSTPAFLYHFALAISEYIKAHFSIERSNNGWVKAKAER